MCDEWEDKAIEAECEEDEPVNLQLYSDHRRGDATSAPPNWAESLEDAPAES